MTRITPCGLGLALGLGFVGGTPVVAQPAVVESSSTEPSSTWTFDAGVSTVLGRRAGWSSESSTIGGWIGVGSGDLRLNVDYWHNEERREDTMYFQEVEMSIVDQMDIAAVWRFRTGRALSPHVLAGVGFERLRSHNCWDTPIGRRCSDGSGISSVPADSGSSLVLRRQRFVGLYGAGIDIALGRRFFARAQVRAYPDRSAYYSFLGRVATIIGGGVRF